MKIATLFIALTFSFVGLSQIETQLRIYHRLGADPYAWNVEVQNNLGQAFKITRLEYYVTRLSVVHDGGQITAVSDDTVALIKANDWYSTIELGELNVTDVEAVKFHIGVYAPVNNEDPSLYPAEHPLAPKNPSMHWGWASGYRFLAYEGVAGVNFSQTIQMHALGNHNYFETTVSTGAHLVNGELIIAIDGDYLKGVQDIHLSDGVIAHGVDDEDLDAILNFRDLVFTERTGELATPEIAPSELHVFPIPSSNGLLTVKAESNFDAIRIMDLSGRVVYEKMDCTDDSIELNLEQLHGVYVIDVVQQGSVLARKQIVLL
jgi:hypothetical protein